MQYSSTITKKGQMTLPKEIRKHLFLNIPSRVFLDFDRVKKTLRIKPTKDLLDLAGKIKIRKKISALKARQALEKSYHRS